MTGSAATASSGLQLVDVGERSLAAYRGTAPEDLLDAVEQVAESLRGLRVLQVNATPYGGGVSELLRSTVPLLVDLGIRAEWRVVPGTEDFFRATKAVHNGLQGAPDDLSAQARAAYLANAESIAAAYDGGYDVVVVHDPQPMALASLVERDDTRWVWRCHIDTSAPQPQVWEFLRGYLDAYDAAVFTMAQFVPPGLPPGRVRVIPPAIDPISPKNLRLPDRVSEQVLDWMGLHLGHPLVTQVSRFDPWKDPLGVIEAYRLARDRVPNLQLVLAGSMALDDPEGWEIYQLIEREVRRDGGIHVFTNLTGVGNVEVNALQQRSAVVVQKSLREGFGLVVSEALWKGTPVVAGDVGGIPLQMADGAGGLLVGTVEACADAIVTLLEDPDLAAELGRSGRERVRRQFLVPRLLLDELSLLAELAGARAEAVRRPGTGAAVPRDPVCGMAVPDAERAPSLELAGRRVVFCSDGCRAVFAARTPRTDALTEPPRG